MSTEETKPVVEATEPTTTAPLADAAVAPLAPTTGTDVEAVKPETTEAAAVEEPAATEAAAAAPAEEAVAEKTIEPITEGQLAYKGPGLVKSLIPSKKEFWLSDDAVAAENMDLFTRGEKPEIAHPIVAWASQTGKGLLFMNKKNATDRTHPADVLALYDATELKKQTPHEFSFKLNGHNHTFKAANDAERDGWYLSIEKAVELGKASKEEIVGSEGYKAESEKLSKPAVPVVAAAGSASKPKKSVEVPATERVGSEDAETAEQKDVKKTQKSRSTSRGMLARFKGKKEEAEQKVAEKKEEKEAEKEEQKAEEASPVTDATEAAPIAAAVAAAEIPAAAEAAEKPVEETPAAVEEKPKPNKRASIFGKFSMKSPSKEKDAKEAELKAETPKDAVVSENPPQLPETTTEPAVETAIPAVEEPAAETTEAPKETEVATPSKEKTKFLSGIGGFMKRNRSVSPSTAMKEAPKKEETPAPAVEEPVIAAEPVKVEEPATEAGAVAEPVAAEETAEEKKETTPNKRQSVLGSLGRRASKAFKGMQAPKKENAAPATSEASKEEATEAKATEETPVVNGETSETKTEDAQKSIGDVVPDAVNVGQPQPVAASA